MSSENLTLIDIARFIFIILEFYIFCIEYDYKLPTQYIFACFNDENLELFSVRYLALSRLAFYEQRFRQMLDINLKYLLKSKLTIRSKCQESTGFILLEWLTLVYVHTWSYLIIYFMHMFLSIVCSCTFPWHSYRVFII